MENKISLNIRCPSCSGDLQPSALICRACGIKIEGEFVKNEFNSLTPDELHFLRVFIRCEGKINDMEASLGVSYPTVKTHLSALRNKLNLTGSGSEQGAADLETNGARKEESLTGDKSGVDILSQLENGEIGFKKAVQILRARKKDAEK